MPLGHVVQEEDDARGEGQQADDQHQVPPNTWVKAFESLRLLGEKTTRIRT